MVQVLLPLPTCQPDLPAAAAGSPGAVPVIDGVARLQF